MKPAIILSIALLFLSLVSCEDENPTRSDVRVDTVYVDSAWLRIDLPGSGDTIQEIFPVTLSFPPEVPVHWARIVDAATGHTVSWFDQFYRSVNDGKITLWVSKLVPQPQTSFYAMAVTVDSDTIVSPILTVANLKEPVGWPIRLCDILEPEDGDTLDPGFYASFRIDGDTLPINSIRALDKAYYYDPAVLDQTIGPLAYPTPLGAAFSPVSIGFILGLEMRHGEVIYGISDTVQIYYNFPEKASGKSP